MCGVVSTNIYARRPILSAPYYENGIFEKNPDNGNYYVYSTSTTTIYKEWKLDFDDGLHVITIKAFDLSNPNCPMESYAFATSPIFV